MLKTSQLEKYFVKLDDTYQLNRPEQMNDTELLAYLRQDLD